MTVIEQANIFNKTTHPNFFLHRLITKKTLDVYATPTTIITPNKSIKSKLILPPIDKDDQRRRQRIKRPIYRTSLYHAATSSFTQIELTPLTTRGKKPDAVIPIRDDQTMVNFYRHLAPPPSPSDDQVERILSQLTRTQQTTPIPPVVTDGNVPYRLPALSQSVTQTRSAMNIPPKDIKSSLSTYLQRYY